MSAEGQNGEQDESAGGKRQCRAARMERGEQEREETTGESEGLVHRIGGLSGSGGIQRSVGTGAESRQDSAGLGTDSGTVAYDPGPDVSRLSERYGVDFCRDGQAEHVQRLEDDFGQEQVSRWADEGMTVETMGKPRDMAAYRERADSRPAAVPTDIERRNQASAQRNGGGKTDGPAGEAGVPDEVRRVIASPGRSMDETVQREMESKMGGEFSDVRIHTGPAATEAAESINARAFTVGNHVAFARGEYDPDTQGGKKVLAHELTHVRQQTEGAVSLLLQPGADHPGLGVNGGVHIQPKLEVSSPDDPAEKEAEKVAEAVMKMDSGGVESNGEVGAGGDSGAVIQPVEAGDEADAHGKACTCGRCGPAVRPSRPEARPTAETGGAVDGDMESVVRSGVSGSGKPIPSDTRSEMESSMGADFSDVQVHTGPEANEAAQSIQAEAYTMGSDIAFAKGRYAPESNSGKKLLAHELTHVTQQQPVSRVCRQAVSNRMEFEQLIEEDPEEARETLDEMLDDDSFIPENPFLIGRENVYIEELYDLPEEFEEIPNARAKERVIESQFGIEIDMDTELHDFDENDQNLAELSRRRRRNLTLDEIYHGFYQVEEEFGDDMEHLPFHNISMESGNEAKARLGWCSVESEGSYMFDLLQADDIAEDGTVIHEIGHGIDGPPGGPDYSTESDFRDITEWQTGDNPQNIRSALEDTVEDPYLDDEGNDPFEEAYEDAGIEEQYDRNDARDVTDTKAEEIIARINNQDWITQDNNDELYPSFVDTLPNLIAVLPYCQEIYAPWQEGDDFFGFIEEYQNGPGYLYQGYADFEGWVAYPVGARDHLLEISPDGYAGRHPLEDFAEMFRYGMQNGGEFSSNRYQEYWDENFVNTVPIPGARRREVE